MFDGTFEQSTILRTGPDGLTRVLTRRSSAERESVLVELTSRRKAKLRKPGVAHSGALVSASWKSLGFPL
jgi:hypothetical protein